jgi:hypothetical protein
MGNNNRLQTKTRQNNDICNLLFLNIVYKMLTTGLANELWGKMKIYNIVLFIKFCIEMFSLQCKERTDQTNEIRLTKYSCPQFR